MPTMPTRGARQAGRRVSSGLARALSSGRTHHAPSHRCGERGRASLSPWSSRVGQTDVWAHGRMQIWGGRALLLPVWGLHRTELTGCGLVCSTGGRHSSQGQERVAQSLWAMGWEQADLTAWTQLIPRLKGKWRLRATPVCAFCRSPNYLPAPELLFSWQRETWAISITAFCQQGKDKPANIC